jgi:site-specific DNA recombinase
MAEKHSTEPQAAVAYYRMSTTAQEASIPEQRDWARPAIARDGYELVGELEDPGISGSEIERRADLQALIDFFEKRHKQKRPVRHLYLWDTDRFSRASSIRTAAVLDRLMMAGLTHIHTPDEVIDLEEDLDVVLFNLKQDLTNAAYAKCIGKNVLRSRQAKSRAGLWSSGPVPKGYLVGNDGHLIIDPVWGPTIRWIFDRYTTTADSLADICRRLNADPTAPRPRSGQWAAPYVRRVLTHTVYLGTITYGERSSGKYYQNAAGQVERVKGNHGRKVTRRAAPGSAIICEGAHEALVDKATFDAAARKLVGNRWTNSHHSGRRGVWVLTGLAFCGCCGHRLCGKTHRRQRGQRRYVWRRLFCPTRQESGVDCGAGLVRQETVLEELAAMVKAEFGKPARVERIGRQIEKLIGQQESDNAQRREVLSAKLARLDSDIATASRRLLVLPEDEFAELHREFAAMKRQRGELDAELARIEDAHQVSQEEARRMRDALADLGQLEEVIADKPAELVRDLLARIVEKITLYFEEPGEPNAAGQRLRPLSHIDVTFRPEVAHLFCAGSSLHFGPTAQSRRYFPSSTRNRRTPW